MVALVFLVPQITFASELNLVSDDFQGEEGINESWTIMDKGISSVYKMPYKDAFGNVNYSDTVIHFFVNQPEYPDTSRAGISKSIPAIIGERFYQEGAYIGYEIQDDYAHIADPATIAYFDSKIIFENRDSVFIRFTTVDYYSKIALSFKIFKSGVIIKDTVFYVYIFSPDLFPKFQIELLKLTKNTYTINDLVYFDIPSIPTEIQFYAEMLSTSQPQLNDAFWVSIDDIYCYPDYNNFMVAEYPTEIGVLKDENINVNFKNMFTLEPINEVSVKLTDNKIGGYLAEGITDVNGDFGSIAYLEANYPIELLGEKSGYITYTGNITAYLWSNVPEAFGTNNQEHIVRKPNTDEIDMVYTTGENVVYGRSIDFGQTWDLDVLGRGTEPVLTRTASGLIAVWRDGTSSYIYSIKSSPWIPVDTLINPAILLSEPVLGYNSMTSQTYLGYISHNYLQREKGDYILASMDELNTDDIYYDTVVSYLGDVNNPAIVPMKSPVFSLYSQPDFGTSKLIGFINTMRSYTGKLWDEIKMEWQMIFTISNIEQICNAPTTDYYGNATSFVYEAINTDETKDIYRRKLNKGIIDANAVKVNVTTGKNEYPKASNGIFINYINNSNKLITNYSGNDISVYTGADSIHTTEFETKPLLMTKVRGYHIWSEGSNGNYRIKWMTKDYYPAIFTFIESEPEDTVEKVTTSPLYEYIGKKEPVEQLNTTINGLNPEMNYTVKVITSEGSPVKPQIIQIDGEVYAIVTGHANRPDTTEITLPQETYQDYSVVVSIDRKRGNPNRTAEVLVYQYETDGEEVVAVSNKIKTFAQITESKEINKNIFTLKDEVSVNYTSEKEANVEVRVYDVSGREVTSIIAKVNKGTSSIKLSNTYKTGVYFTVIKNGEETETSRINIIK